MLDPLNTSAVVLCGGSGSRLFPMTAGINKHLLPIYSKPMVYYSLATVMLLGIRSIKIVCNPKDRHLFEHLLMFFDCLGVSISFIEQDKADGVVGGLARTLPTISTQKILLLLGDNLFYGSSFPSWCVSQVSHQTRCHIFTQQVRQPERFGVVLRDPSDAMIDLVEKPSSFISSEAITGLYYFDISFVRSVIERVMYSTRGELEVTSLLKIALNQAELSASKISRGTFWIDAGTVDDLFSASEYIKSYETRHGRYVLSPEEVAYQNGWVQIKNLRRLISAYPQSNYKDTLIKMFA